MFSFEKVAARRSGMMVSLALHVAVLGVLLHRPQPVFVRVQPVRLGNGPKSYHVVYVPPDATRSDRPEAVEHNKFAMVPAPRLRPAQPNAGKPKQAADRNPEGSIADRNAHAGTIHGSLWALMEQGHDVKPAYPVVFPAPDFSHLEFPPGYQADVVVEVSIDRDGFVFESKIIRSLGPAVDQKALAAVQNWRFHPAVLDGRPIASKHDVYFHLPS